MSRIAKLPAGYRQVEYIQSSGEQYVDTGFKANQNTRVVMDAQATGANTGRYFVGARKAYGDSVFGVWSSSGTAFMFCHGNATESVTKNVAARYLLDLNKNSFFIDGVLAATATANTFQCPVNLWLFACNNNGAVMSATDNLKMYSCQIYDNGTLVRDYIPCTNSSGKAGLYDLVYGVFYGNAGTGVFAVGRNVYSEDEITKLEYVESTGEQYVDTEFKPNQDTRVVMDFELLSVIGQYADPIFGVRTSASSNAFYLWASGWPTTTEQYQSGYNNTSHYVAVPRIGRHTVDKNKNVTTIDGVSSSGTYASFTTSWNMLLFNSYNNGALYGDTTCMRLRSCQIYDNDTFIRDYLPAKVDGKIGLWDALSGILYTDAAGGTFIAGPEVISIAPPKNLAAVITEAGVVLTWDAEEKALGYKVYRDETNIAYTTESSYTDGTAKPDNNYIYGVSAYNADTETEATEITVFVESPYSPLELITDRTQKALDRVIELAGKDYMTEMSAEEQEEWRDGMKGAYNASDMNRVGKAVDALAKLLRELVPALKNYAEKNQIGWDAFYAPPFDPSKMYPATKRDWTVRDIPAPADMELYLSNIKLLRSALVYNTDALPATMENLTWSGANAIEKALFALDGAIIIFSADMRMMIDKAVAARFYSDEIYSGEV